MEGLMLGRYKRRRCDIKNKTLKSKNQPGLSKHTHKKPHPFWKLQQSFLGACCVFSPCHTLPGQILRPHCSSGVLDIAPPKPIWKLSCMNLVAKLGPNIISGIKLLLGKRMLSSEVPLIWSLRNFMDASAGRAGEGLAFCMRYSWRVCRSLESCSSLEVNVLLLVFESMK